MTLRKYITPPNLVVILTVCYAVSEAMMLSAMIRRLFYIPLYALLFYYMCKSIFTCPKNSYVKALIFILIFFFLYGILLIINGYNPSWVGYYSSGKFLMDIFESISPIFVFYYFGLHNKIDDKWFQYIFILFFIGVCAEHISGAMFQYSKRFLGSEADIDITNNSGYYWASLLAMIPFFDGKTLLQYIMMAIITVMSVISNKFGAILCVAVIDVYLLWNIIKGARRNKKVFIIVISICLLFAGYYYLLQISANSDILTLSLDDNANGRDTMYPLILRTFMQQDNIFHFIFGNGAQGTIHILGFSAHNDWLEIAMSMGLVGLFVYLIYWIKFFRTYLLSKEILKRNLTLVIGSFIILYFGKTMFSMSIYEISIYAAAPLGYCMAKYTKSLYGYE